MYVCSKENGIDLFLWFSSYHIYLQEVFLWLKAFVYMNSWSVNAVHWAQQHLKPQCSEHTSTQVDSNSPFTSAALTNLSPHTDNMLNIPNPLISSSLLHESDSMSSLALNSTQPRLYEYVFTPSVMQTQYGWRQRLMHMPLPLPAPSSSSSPGALSDDKIAQTHHTQLQQGDILSQNNDMSCLKVQCEAETEKQDSADDNTTDNERYQGVEHNTHVWERAEQKEVCKQSDVSVDRKRKKARTDVTGEHVGNDDGEDSFRSTCKQKVETEETLLFSADTITNNRSNTNEQKNIEGDAKTSVHGVGTWLQNVDHQHSYPHSLEILGGQFDSDAEVEEHEQKTAKREKITTQHGRQHKKRKMSKADSAVCSFVSGRSFISSQKVHEQQEALVDRELKKKQKTYRNNLLTGGARVDSASLEELCAVGLATRTSYGPKCCVCVHGGCANLGAWTKHAKTAGHKNNVAAFT